jgi:hypothetical protein
MDKPDALPSPTKDARMKAFRSASWPDRLAMHEAIAAAKADALAERRALAASYLERHASPLEVPYERAVGQVSLAAETRAAREEAIALAIGKDAQHTSASLQYPVLSQSFAADSETIRLATSPLFIAPIARYCGMLPVLFNLFVTRAYQTELNTKSAHHFHMDPEDTISFKVFIHLTDVDDSCGPFHALPADKTEQVLKAVGYQGIDFLPDERIAELVGWDSVVRFTGPPGTVALADTTRCLHFGGRPRAEGKPVRDMLVFQYLLPTSVLFPVNGDAKHPNFFPQLEPSGDATWDALIGATLT